MDQGWPVSLQVALYAASIAIVVLTVVLIVVLLKVRVLIERLVSAVEHAEAEITPLAREARIVFLRVGNLTDQTQRIVDGASGIILPPVLLARRVINVARSGLAAFVNTLWRGSPRASRT